MFSPNKISNSPLSSSFEQPVYQHQHHVRNLQNEYFNKQYQKSINEKIQKQEEEQLKKRQQLELYKQKNQQFLSQVEMGRYLKMQQKQYMADKYEESIREKKYKEMKQKQNEKSFQKNILGQQTWIRDEGQQRQLIKQKNKNYSMELQEHVRAQEQRKHEQIQRQRKMRDRLSDEAQQILDKEYQQLQRRFKRKSMFQQRQNQLLGIPGLADQYHDSTVNLSNSGVSTIDGKSLEERILRRKQKEVYGKGLDYQRHRYEQIKRKQWQEPKYTPHQGYNPITNPLPLVYKNPNVLRMLGQQK